MLPNCSWEALSKKVRELPQSRGEHAIEIGMGTSGPILGYKVYLWKDQEDPDTIVQMDISGYGFAGYIPPEVWEEPYSEKRVILLETYETIGQINRPTENPEFSMLFGEARGDRGVTFFWRPDPKEFIYHNLSDLFFLK